MTLIPPPRTTTDFSKPVGHFSVPVECVHSSNSIQAVASELQEASVPLLPVIEHGVYLGMVGEEDLARALAIGLPTTTAIGEIITGKPPTIKGYESAATALRMFVEAQVECIAVTDDYDRVLGVVTPSRFVAQDGVVLRPKMVGGMASPVGVYLTSGSVTGGVSQWALVLTGAFMLLMFIVGQYAAIGLGHLIPSGTPIAPEILLAGQDIVSILVFLGLLRAMPLAGYHGAEHMVVNAIEQGEPLVPEVVGRMSRVHPRCGTNFAVAAVLFLSILNAPIAVDQSLKLLVAFIVTGGVYRPLGGFAQYYLTTRKPSEKELLAGIEAGKSLLANYQTSHHSQAGFLWRLFNSGLFHIMAGSTLTAILITLILTVLRVPEEWMVISLT